MQELKDKVLALLYDHALNSKTRGRGRSGAVSARVPKRGLESD